MLAGARPVVPALWHLEMANGLWVAERRGHLTAADLEKSLMDIENALVQFEVDSALISARQALATARPYRLTAYDAVYLDAARRHSLPLATLDEKLRAAALKAGVALVR